jgi:predicted O-methyltransferase YrrM
MNILEIGTYTGYSALCLCEGMQENGILHTIDIKEELVDFKESILTNLGKRRSYNT